MKITQTKKLKCSACPRYASGTHHTLDKVDAIGAWYNCDKCKKTSTCIPKGDE